MALVEYDFQCQDARAVEESDSTKTRAFGFLIPSIAAHVVALSLMSFVPLSESRASMIEVVEFAVITELGGGRLGQDREIGAALEEPQPARPAPKRRARPPTERPKTRASQITKDVAAAPEESSTEPTPSTGAVAHGTVNGSAGTDPNATAPGAGSGQEGVSRRVALRAWLREVQREVNKLANRKYPKSAVRMGVEGKLRLGLTIASDGEIKHVRLIKSSGHSVLDQSAAAAVMRMRVPAPPNALRWREREIPLPVRYAL